MTDFIGVLFERLANANCPDARAREEIYEEIRRETSAHIADDGARAKALEKLEKAIRRQEMQAIYEEGLGRQ